MNRTEYEKRLKNSIRIMALKTRAEHNMTQREMADYLQLSENAYSNIETGRSGGNSLTVILLLQMQAKTDESLKALCRGLRGFDDEDRNKPA